MGAEANEARRSVAAASAAEDVFREASEDGASEALIDLVEAVDRRLVAAEARSSRRPLEDGLLPPEDVILIGDGTDTVRT